LLTLGERPFKIVGIVGDTRFEIAEPSQPTFYFPLYIGTEGAGTLAIRSTHDVSSLALPIQEIADRWIGAYERARLDALADLKFRLEGDPDG